MYPLQVSSKRLMDEQFPWLMKVIENGENYCKSCSGKNTGENK